jgi:hypothetical protein
MTFDGDTITLSGSFRPPVGEISRVHALLRPAHAGPSCPVAEAEAVYGENGTTTTTQPPGGPDDGSVAFSLSSFPMCNDVYDIEVRAYAGPVGPDEAESPPLELRGVNVVLRPPSPKGPLVVERPPEPTALVTVRWSAPDAYSVSTPPGFLGYRVERALGSAPFDTVETTTATSFTDGYTGAAGAGQYRYRVLTLRMASDDPEAPASTAILNSAPESAPVGEIVIEAPPTTTTATTPPPVTSTGGRSGGRSTTGRSGGVPQGGTAVSDSGFTETLDYSDFEFGSEEAVPPADASDFIRLEDEEAPGSPVARPVAIASVLAMWAFHLRYLSRRADQAA